MKKIISVLISLLLIISCGACAIKEESKKNHNQTESSDESILNSEAGKRVEAGSDGFIEPVKHLTEAPEGYVEIRTVEELKAIEENTDLNYILMNDIDLTNYTPWYPIKEHNGIFDGNGYSIIGLNQISTHNDVNGYLEYGVFAKANVIKNLGIRDVNINLVIKDKEYVNHSFLYFDFGTISPYANSVENCFTTGNIVIDEIFNNFLRVNISCLVAEAYNVKNCYSSCELNINEYEFESVKIGGLAAEQCGPVENSYFDGKIKISNTYNHFADKSSIMIGGLVGYLTEVCYVVNCRNSGEIYLLSETYLPSEIYVGGISAFSKDVIKDSYNTGKINVIQKNGDSKLIKAGGVTGCLYSSYIKTDSCYNTGEINVEAKDNAFAGGLIGAAELKPNWQFLPDIQNCFNTGAVTVISENGNGYAGGIAGTFAGDIITSYNNAVIKGNNTAPITPLATENNRLDITDCYSIIVNGSNYSVDNGVKELSTDEAAKASSYSGFTFDSHTETENLTAGLYGEIEDAVKYEIEVKCGYWIINKSNDYKYPIIANTYSEL